MVQPFCSIYTKSYRAFDRDPEVEKAKPCLYFSDLKENFLPTEDSKTIYNPERDEAVLKDLYQKRLFSIYQESYCTTEGKKSMVIDPNDLEADQFMVYLNNYYAKKMQPVPRPLLTARRVFGYCSFENYYTGKTSYEEEIGREAYKFFKKDYDEGKSRLFRKKQTAIQKQMEGGTAGDKIEQVATPSETEEGVKQKVCALCCNKFREFSYGIPCFSDESRQIETEPRENGSS